MYPIISVLFCDVLAKNQMKKFDSFVQPDVLSAVLVTSGNQLLANIFMLDKNSRAPIIMQIILLGN
jgi:hypothetical protein